MFKLSEFELKIEEFMLFCTSKNLSKRSLTSYEQTLKLLAMFLKEKFGIDNTNDVTKITFKAVY